MLLDLHAHSIKSDDGRAKVQNYCQWIKAKSIPIDGFDGHAHGSGDEDDEVPDGVIGHVLIPVCGRARARPSVA